jgi:hypothetical protein
MKLPNLDNALVHEAKIKDYLLSETHDLGKEKAAFFTSFGFTATEWTVLAAALLQHAYTHEVSKIIESVHGIKYVIEGTLHTPDQRQPRVRVVWMVDAGSRVPRLVTAYPLEDEAP